MWLLSCSNLFAAGIVAYFAITIHQLYKLANPLSGVEVKGPGIEPLWKEGQLYDIVCFLSKDQSLSKINLAKLVETNQIIFQQDRLIHQSHQSEVSLAMKIKSKQSSQANGTIVNRDIFRQVQGNSTNVYLHVIVKMNGYGLSDIQTATPGSPGWWLHGSVQMIKHDVIPRSFRYRYLLSDFGWADEDSIQKKRLEMKKTDVISYWKPEVSVRMVADFATYPFDHVPEAVGKNIVVRKAANNNNNKNSKQKNVKGDHFYFPSMYVDETGLTSDKYIHLNETVEALPLQISIGPMSSQRWLLMAILEEALSTQKSLGFSDKDIDDIRRMITETSLSFLLVTMIASTLHLLFEYLAFRSDVKFWKDNKSLAGLSTRSVVTDLLSQAIVFLYLVESDASLLVIIPSFIGILIQIWKAKKATGFVISFGGPYLLTIAFSRWNTALPPTEQKKEEDTVATNVDKEKIVSAVANKCSDKSQAEDNAQVAEVTTANADEDKLVRVTLEADRVATYYIGGLLLPFVIAYILRSLIYERHLSWYSWIIGSFTSCVYTFGFVLMCPQLYINHQLKSVSHLPWQFLIYKFLNTFVDDLFAFIIKMPMMHRLSVFRDDIVFLIYLYQRWIYRIDKNRPYEK